jgi:hypothetical protein
VNFNNALFCCLWLSLFIASCGNYGEKQKQTKNLVIFKESIYQGGMGEEAE